MSNPWEQRLGIWSIAEEHGDLPAVVASPADTPLTFAQLAGEAHRVVHALRAAGLRAGDFFTYALPNDIDIVVWQLAAMESGMRSIALNPALSAGEISSIMSHSGAAGLVVHERYGEQVADMTADSVRVRVAIGGDIPGFVPVTEFVSGQPTSVPPDRILGGPLVYSSGTTGTPKAIWRRLQEIDPADAADVMKSFGHAFRFLPLEGVHLVSAGMHHGGCQSFYHGALNVGQALAIMGRFDPEEALRIIETQRVTTAYMVPTQFVRLLRLPEEVRGRYDTSSLQVVSHAAAPCPVEIKRQMMRWWGPVIWETYGGMEGAATIAKPHRWLEKPGTVGRAVKGMTVSILDDDGNALPAGEVGHVYLDAPGMTFEYRGDPGATAEVHRGRAFTLGDVGYLDEDGYLFLCDRAKDLIISGGVNVYPAEIEGVLAAHPCVGDVAVIGVPDDEWGEQVKAVVELVETAEPSEELEAELSAFCREHLAGYKCPRSFDFRDDLQRTDGGKLAKRAIREQYWAEVGRAL